MVIKYSVIILLEEESEGFSKFICDIHRLFSLRKESFEIVIIANGIEGFLRNEIKELQENQKYCDNFTFLTLNRKTPQAVCLRAAFTESRGEIIVICTTYQQITEDSFNQLLDALDDSTDVIAPWRQGRVDPPLNQMQSQLFNDIVRKLTKIELHDLSCTVKITRRIVLEEVELYGNMYRFLPILAERRGFSFKEVKCEHYQERGKTGIYSFSEYFERIIDIITLYFNIYFARKPLRFFGSLGVSFFLVGMLILFFIFMQKMLLNYFVGDHPMSMLLGFLFIALGVQSSGVGLLAEIIVFIHGRSIKEYNVSEYFSKQYKGLERRREKYYFSSAQIDVERRKNL